MKKNNKGFFLAETIVVIALVTTVMAFVYPNVSKLNENYNYRTNYYDQTEDLFTLKAAYNLLEGEYINFVYKPLSSPIGEFDPYPDANTVVSTNFLGFFTFDPKENSGKGSAGCLNYSAQNENNHLYISNDTINTYCSPTNPSGNCKFAGMFKIYDKYLTGELGNRGFELALDYIRKNNNYQAGMPNGFNFPKNNTDYFTCIGDYYGLSNSLNLNIPSKDRKDDGLKCITTKNTYNSFFSSTELEELYISNYMEKPSSSNYNFNKYLKRLKKTSNDVTSYRLIGVFKKGNSIRYASIKIANPNPNRNCNLGG